MSRGRSGGVEHQKPREGWRREKREGSGGKLWSGGRKKKRREKWVHLLGTNPISSKLWPLLTAPNRGEHPVLREGGAYLISQDGIQKLWGLRIEKKGKSHK